MKRILFTVLASSISSPFRDEREKLRTTCKFQHGGERLEDHGRIRNCVLVWLQQNRRKIYSTAAKYRNRGNDDDGSHTQPTCCAHRVEVSSSFSKQYMTPCCNC